MDMWRGRQRGGGLPAESATRISPLRGAAKPLHLLQRVSAAGDTGNTGCARSGPHPVPPRDNSQSRVLLPPPGTRAVPAGLRPRGRHSAIGARRRTWVIRLLSDDECLYAMYRFSKHRVRRDVCESLPEPADRGRIDTTMTTPTVTELPCRREPVSADTFLGELALGEQRSYGDTKTALIALGLRPQPPSCQLDLFEPGPFRGD
jgi:hypothetical protein